MNRFVAIISIACIRLLRYIPFKVVHFLSNVIAFLLRRVVKYRTQVVRDNLKRCFPDYNIKQIHKIEKAFYYNVSDILLEGLKGLTMSEQEIVKRFKILNPEILDQYYSKNQSVICLAGHYANWEWGIQAVNPQIQHQAVSIYKALSNNYLEDYFHQQRSRLGMHLYPMEETRLAFQKVLEQPSAIILASDQSPSNTSKSIIVDFFNDRIGFIHGAEAYAMKTGLPVIYFDVQRVKRSYYTLEIKELHPANTPLKKGVLTQKYASMLEEVIKKKPEDWLWSHKRWKHDYAFHPDY